MGELIDIEPLKENLLIDIKEKILKIDKRKKIVFLSFSESVDAKIYLNELKEIFNSLKLEYLEYNLKDKSSKYILETLQKLSIDDEINGILPIRPFPKNIDEEIIYSNIEPKKDIDCLSFTNLGKLFSFKAEIIPSVVEASFEILKYYVKRKFNNLDYLTGKVATIVGRSINTGRPIYILSLMNNLVPINLHSKVKNIEKFLKLADIIFACCGVPEFIKGEMVKENSIIIDIGINKSINNKIVGDVDTKSVLDKVMGVTKVPHGVGEITKLILVRNFLKTFNFI